MKNCRRPELHEAQSKHVRSMLKVIDCTYFCIPEWCEAYHSYTLGQSLVPNNLPARRVKAPVVRPGVNWRPLNE